MGLLPPKTLNLSPSPLGDLSSTTVLITSSITCYRERTDVSSLKKGNSSRAKLTRSSPYGFIKSYVSWIRVSSPSKGTVSEASI